MTSWVFSSDDEEKSDELSFLFWQSRWTTVIKKKKPENECSEKRKNSRDKFYSTMIRIDRSTERTGEKNSTFSFVFSRENLNEFRRVDIKLFGKFVSSIFTSRIAPSRLESNENRWKFGRLDEFRSQFVFARKRKNFGADRPAGRSRSMFVQRKIVSIGRTEQNRQISHGIALFSLQTVSRERSEKISDRSKSVRFDLSTTRPARLLRFFFHHFRPIELSNFDREKFFHFRSRRFNKTPKQRKLPKIFFRSDGKFFLLSFVEFRFGSTKI